MAYDQIKLHINIAQNSYPFRCGRGQIIIDLDNQEYIIAVLEACANWYSRFKYPEAQQKAEWYKNAAVEARQRKELFAKQLEEARIQEEAQREKEQVLSNVYLVLGLILFFAFIVFFFS